jgi:hypothetical protein
MISSELTISIMENAFSGRPRNIHPVMWRNPVEKGSCVMPTIPDDLDSAQRDLYDALSDTVERLRRTLQTWQDEGKFQVLMLESMRVDTRVLRALLADAENRRARPCLGCQT